VPNVMGVLRAEIRRLARKETKQELNSMRKQVTQMRRLLAESRRRVSDLEARVKQAMRARGAAAAREAADEEGGTQVRFSPAWVKKHRSKLGMSRLLYAQLVGVSPQTIMGWEAGRTRPRPGALRAWRAIRGRGVRELRAMLANGSGGGASTVRKRRVRRRLKRAVRRARVRGAIRRVRLKRTVRRARVRRAVRTRVARKRTVRRVRAGKKK
jgi:DNA-binding transcriptional regulator YiaG